MFKHKRYLLSLVLLVASVLVPATALAGTAATANVTTSYGTDSTVQKGMIVQLSKDPSKVQPLSDTDIDKMMGVVVAANDSALTLTSDTKDRQVFVAVNGKVDVLVSNQNGSIIPGDFITISSLNGVGMKATADQSMVVGKALSAFDGTSDVAGNETLKTTDGKSKQVSLGHIRVQLDIQANPLQNLSLSEGATRFLSHLGYTITSKPVSPNRLYLGLLILVITAIIAGSILFSGVRSTVISIGRNPLAKSAILKGLIQIVITSLIVFITGIFAVYLLLKL